MRLPTCVFVACLDQMEAWFLSLKQKACPYCGRIGTLNRHGSLYGNDPAHGSNRVFRGRRAYCSNRGNRPGCGRSFSVLLAEFIPRHSLTASLLQGVLDGVEGGRTIKSAWERLKTKLALETFYHFLQRLRRVHDRVRCLLSSLLPAPSTTHRAAFPQTLAHLRGAFPGSACAVAAFQCRLQKAFSG